MAARQILKACSRFGLPRNFTHTIQHTGSRKPGVCAAVRCMSSAAPVSAVRDNVWSCPYPDVDIPEVDFGRYMLNDLGKYGDATALIDGATGHQVSFAELQTQVVRAASALARMGVGPGDVVNMFVPNCVEFPVIFLAAVSLGAVASAVNPLYTPGELQHALSHSNAKVIFTVPALLPVAREALQNCPSVKHIICTEAAEGCRPFSSLMEDDGHAFPENLDLDIHQMATLPYSSGTTGLPKGVMLSHYNIVANLEQMRHPMVAAYREDDCPAGVLPFFHIYGLSIVLMLSLKQGIPMALMPKFDPELYLQTVQDNRCTHLYIVPPIILFLAQHPMVDNYDLSAVRSIITAAAPVSVDMCEKAGARLNNEGLIIRQGFGMTETSPITHCNSETNIKLSSVGQVVPNTKGKIVDTETGEALGPNQTGEICMKGPQVMLGYYKNEQATADTVDEDGWIHSGDIGHVDEEGFFYITDRIKELIKFKGFQVAPAELEALLVTHPAISDAAVIGIPDERAGELPRAYVVLKPGKQASEQDVADFVKENMASYKQLSGGVDIRGEIPKSASGKILRRLLKDEYLGKN